MAITKKRRFEIFKRDKFTCQYDHVIPVSAGGKDELRNDDDAWRYFCGICWRSIKAKAGDE